MEKHKTRGRNFSLDIIRCVALFTVVSVHFFMYIGFYSNLMVGKRMYIMTVMRTAFMVCVPLFMILSGYLMNQKTVCKKYYMGLIKTLSIYFLASVACTLYKAHALHATVTAKAFILSILDFTGANYSWYVEMYIGLFLLIPFLNVAYNGLKTQNQKICIVVTMIALTALPSLFNIYNFNIAGWWSNPTVSDEFSKILPNWWNGLFPITYYFIGCYLKEFDIKLHKSSNILLLLLSTFAFGTFNFYRSYGTNFKANLATSWGGFQNTIMTVLLFVLLSHLNANKLPRKAQWLLEKMSNLSFGAYLSSYIFDTYVYAELSKAVPVIQLRLEYYFIVVPLIFVSSLLLSCILNAIYTVVSRVVKLIYSQIKLKCFE